MHNRTAVINDLTGGDGNDVFVFSDAAGGGHDTIRDFEANNAEKIDLGAVSAITDFRDLVNNLLSSSGEDALITYGSDTILLEGVAFADVGTGLAYSENDFIF